MRSLAAVALLATLTGTIHLPMPALPVDVDAVLSAATWQNRFIALAPDPVPKQQFLETRPVVEVIAHLYGQLDLEPLSDDQVVLMERQLASLPASYKHTLQQLLGAIDTAIPLAAQGETIRATQLLLASIDATSDSLQAEPVPTTDVFPGPNEGILFNDPWNLILVGGPGPSTYWGNTYPAPLSIEPGTHLLIIDPAGDDQYLNHPATATPWLCIIWCNRGLPVSVLVDALGNDLYRPRLDLEGPSIAYARDEGIAILADAAGSDHYEMQIDYGQAVASREGVALLLDATGNDLYLAHDASQARAVARGVAA